MRPCPNLVASMSAITAPNQVWVSDLTYLPLQAGDWVYLLAWMDLFSRRIVGWWVEADMKEALLLKAFEQATARRRPAPGLVVHSNRGGHYFGKTFRQRLRAWQCQQSMAGAHNPYENAHAESF